jgi:exopolyphosphatase
MASLAAVSNRSLSTTASSSLADFLRHRSITPTSHIVIGNPAGDADSILSALTWAYVAKDEVTPVVSISAKDLRTQRPETSLLLQWAQIPADALRHVDQLLDPEHPIIPESIRVTLVDHNRLESSLAQTYPQWTVTAIVDHHFDEGFYTDTCTDRRIAYEKNQATVASTATLVAEEWLQQQQHQTVAGSSLASDVAILLLGTILLDSVNMQASAGKGTARDQAAIDKLLEDTNWQDDKWRGSHTDICGRDGRPIPHKVFDALQQAKFDINFWKSLAVPDALRLDYKEFTPSAPAIPFGVSTVLLDWDAFVHHAPRSRTAIASYMQTRSLDFLGIMCTSIHDHGGLQRQLILCSQQADLLNDMIPYLQALGGDTNLQLMERPSSTQKDDDDSALLARVFDQGNSKASRKQVAPLLMGYFETCSKL